MPTHILKVFKVILIARFEQGHFVKNGVLIDQTPKRVRFSEKRGPKRWFTQSAHGVPLRWRMSNGVLV